MKITLKITLGKTSGTQVSPEAKAHRRGYDQVYNQTYTRKRNREWERAYSKARWQKLTPEEKFLGNTRDAHHVLPEELYRVLIEQGGKCPFCARVLHIGGRDSDSASVDHDHDHCRGERSCNLCFRGIPCYYCNGHESTWPPEKRADYLAAYTRRQAEKASL